MTVCVAAICDGNTIIGASDRMLTAGNIQFEPFQAKTSKLTNSIVLLFAGESALQMEIMLDVQTIVNARVQKHPTTWIRVRDVAELYRKYYNKARNRRTETAILTPLGLDHRTFISKQSQLDPAFVKQIGSELLNYEMPLISTIVCGVDSTGARLYVIDNSSHNLDVTCLDSIGFAAIGTGYAHAESQFMFAGHTRYRAFSETLLLVYSAKKRAEVAPGVGQATDMFMIGPGLGSCADIGIHVLAELAVNYGETQDAIREATNRGRERSQNYVNQLIADATPQDQKAIDDGGNTSGEAPADSDDTGIEPDPATV